MATTRGCNGKVFAGSTPNQVGEVTDFDFAETAEEIDTSVMGSCTSSSQAGSVKTTGNITAFWDAADTGQDELTVGTSVAIELGPEGNGTGNVKYSGAVVILSRSLSSSVGGVVSQTFSWTVNGALTEGTFA